MNGAIDQTLCSTIKKNNKLLSAYEQNYYSFYFYSIIFYEIA